MDSSSLSWVSGAAATGLSAASIILIVIVYLRND